MAYDRNRTIDDHGVVLNSTLFPFTAIVGTGVTPAQAAALAAPIAEFLGALPYYLDEHDRIAYRTNSLALTHAPELVYAAGHPLAGQPIVADLNGGDYQTKHGGAPMPFIDMDTIDPHALKNLLVILRDMQVAILNAV